LIDVLEFDAAQLATGQSISQSLRVHVAEARAEVAPDLAIMAAAEEDLLGGDAAPARPLVPVFFAARGQKLERPLAAEAGRLTPIDRAIAFLRGSNFPVGLVTNGEQWSVVHAPAAASATSGVTSTATWYAEMWLEEPVTFRAFRALFGARRWFNAEPNSTLPQLLERSALNQGAVTAQLGRQVRQAVSMLISALDRADQDAPGDKSHRLLAGIAEATLYEAAISVMMRLVFLFFAEERELLPAADELYSNAYAVSTIREQLQADADRWGAEVLERRHDAWSRLLATFRAVHAGLGHDRLTLPPYGGQLFDPDRFPFLEGRAAGTCWKDSPAVPLPVDNRTILYALEALQILRERGAEPRQLTFRELDVPDIGHVYESLLDHTAKRAAEVTIGLAGASEGEEPEIPLTQLEAWRQASEEKLIEGLAEPTGKTAKSLANLLSIEVDARLRDRLRTACHGDEALLARALPFANLIRSDPWGNLVVILPRSVFVAEGADRRTTGTHYTPASFTEPIVRYTLEPVVYEGPAEGKPEAEWKLKTPTELLKLKVCDMACGSGAFLVAASRYLSARLQQAWSDMGAFEPGSPRRSPEGFESTGAPGEDLIPVDPSEREIYALRVIAQRCLYGVDKNPLAAEMAKLSLWLLTLAKGKPFTFLDHAIKCGDSLIGASREQLEAFDLDDTRQRVFGFGPVLDEISDKRRTLALVRAENVADVERQSRLLADAERKTEALRWIGDTLIEMELRGVDEAERLPVAAELGLALQHDDFESVREISGRYRDEMRSFHWNLEFPETFEGRSGFDAIVGNPPFIGGKKITGVLGKDYREFLVNRIAGGQRGHADYSAYFFLRARTLLQPGCCFGLLATNTIAQGDTREVGLDQITSDCTIIRAIPSRPWPGEASLEVAYVWVWKGSWTGPFVLDGAEVNGITPLLTRPGKATGNPRRLRWNERKSFIGSYVLGRGFIL
jgi:methylase of polypeptide subunit release factors